MPTDAAYAGTMPRPAIRLASAALAPLALLAGCAHDPPVVMLREARLVDRTAEGAVVEFTFQADNDDHRAFPLRDAWCTLRLGGREVATVHRSPEATLRRMGSQTFAIPIAIPAASLPTGPTAFEVWGEVTYLVPGPLSEAMHDSGVRTPAVGLRGEGTIDLGG